MIIILSGVSGVGKNTIIKELMLKRDNLHFILETTMGFMVIKGEELELIKLDTLAGNVSIKGTINSVEYVMENNKKNKEESVLARLFK